LAELDWNIFSQLFELIYSKLCNYFSITLAINEKDKISLSINLRFVAKSIYLVEEHFGIYVFTPFILDMQ
jgi:hypothetical protein